MRKNRAAITIQRYLRGWICRHRYIRLKKSIQAIQRYGRGYMARNRFKIAMENYKATEIQRFCRGYLARKAYQRKLRNIIIVQSCVRKFLARRLFKKMKAEARTISHLEKRYKGLENKIIELQQKYDSINKENSGLKVQVAEIPELK